MKMGGFKRTVVLGLAASALVLASGCRNERAREGQRNVQGQQQAPGTGGAGNESGENTGRQPSDLKQVPGEEGFQSVPKEQTAPSGIGQDGRGGSGLGEQPTGRQPENLKQLPDEKGLQSVPEGQAAPSGIGQDGRGDVDQRQRDQKQDD